MDQSKMTQTELEYSCGAGEAKVNLYTGRLLFEHPDISIGYNSYQINVSHIYNNQFSLPAGLKTYMSPNFKLNIQHFLFKENDELFYYFDGAGYKHEFVLFSHQYQPIIVNPNNPAAEGQYYRITDKYYDTTGLGYTLINERVNKETGFTNTSVITDEIGNQIGFNGDGTVSYTKSIIHSDICKRYQYSEGKLISIYDERISSRKLLFSYRGDLLSDISYYEGNVLRQKISFHYQENLLNLIVARGEKGSTKDLMRFIYKTNGTLDKIIDLRTKKALQLTFIGLKVKKLQKGYVKINSNNPNDSFLGKHNIQSSQFLGEKSYLSPPNNYYNFTGIESVTYKYYDFYTETINEKSVTYQYYFIHDGIPCAIIEKDEDAYKSVKPSIDMGIKLDNGKVSGVNFDGSSILYQYVGQEFFFCDDDSIGIKEINKTKSMERRAYCSGWVNLLDHQFEGNLKLVISFDFTWNNRVVEIPIPKKANQWQYIGKEIDFPSRRIKDVSVSIVSDNENDNYRYTDEDEDEEANAEAKEKAHRVELANIRVLSLTSQPILKEYNLKDFTSANVTTIVDGISKTETIHFTDYMIDPNALFITEADMIATLRSMNFSSNNYSFWYNGKQKRITNVSEVFFYYDEKYIKLLNNSSSNSLFFNETTISGIDNLKVHSYFDQENNLHVIRKLKNFTGQEESIYNIKGLLIEESDEDGIKKIYSHDKYGNVTKVKTISFGISYDPTALMVKHYVYSKASLQIGEGEILVKESNPLGKMIDYTTSDPRTIANINHGTFNKEVTAHKDEYHNHVIKNELGTFSSSTAVPSTLNSQVINTYNDNDMLSEVTVKNKNNVTHAKYTFGYNDYNQINSFAINGREIFLKNYHYGINSYVDDIVKGEYLRTHYDKYNREHYKEKIYSDENYQIIYQDKNEEVSSASKVRKIIDNFAGITHEFQYDDIDQQLMEYDYSCGEDGYKLRAISLEEYKYKFKSIEKDFTKKIVTEDNIKSKIKTMDHLYSYQFGFDNLDRIGIKYVSDGDIRKWEPFAYRYSYCKYFDEIEQQVVSSILLSSVTLSFNEIVKERIVYSYDDYGKVICIENFLATEENPYLEKSYIYDNLGRLITEQVKKNNVLIEKKEYSYDGYGNIKSKTINGIKTTYEYDLSDKDCLKSIKCGDITQTIEYDQCLNPIKYKGNNLTWTRGQMLASYNDNKFEYNESGFRTKKNNKKYLLEGDKIIAEGSGLSFLFYEYDNNGPSSIEKARSSLPSEKYILIKDGEGSIIEIYQYQFLVPPLLLAEYKYDAWGNCTVITHNNSNMGNINPFRWKGHYYDIETNLYYINGNYYDPEIGRMLTYKNYNEIISNAHESIYAFANNNPLSFVSNPYGYQTLMDFYPNPEEIEKRWHHALGTIISGIMAVITGICTFITACTPYGVILGALTIIFGAATLCIGINDAICNETGTNYFIQAYGIRQSTYEIISMAIQITTAVLTIACAFAAKCFIAGTLVLTAAGYKRIEDIVVGDKVLSYHEETGEADYKEVVKLFRNGKDFNTTDVINASEGVKDWINVRVTKFNTNEELDLITNDRIICTLEHPFYVLNADSSRTTVLFEGKEESKAEGSWIASKDLRIGDKLLLSDGESGIISSLEVGHYDEAQTTYNFEVADFHTYYVGTEGILVHNACGGNLVDDVASGADDAKVLKDPWGAERRGYWKSQGRSFEGNINGQLSPSENYFVTGKNVERMLRGRTPIGIDGYSVHLHHTLGKSVDMYTYVEMTRTAHYANFKALHPWMYNG